MQEEITTTFCLCDEFLKVLRVRDDPQAQMNTAEVMTTALVAAGFFAGNQERSRQFLTVQGERAFGESGYLKGTQELAIGGVHFDAPTLWIAIWTIPNVIDENMAA